MVVDGVVGADADASSSLGDALFGDDPEEEEKYLFKLPLRFCPEMYSSFGLFLEKLKSKTPFPFFLFSFLFQKTMYCLDAHVWSRRRVTTPF